MESGEAELPSHTVILPLGAIIQEFNVLVSEDAVGNQTTVVSL
jgi:hypothetical protein